MGRELKITISNELPEIARLAEEVEQFGEQAELDAKVIYRVNLVLDEFLTNAISYGYEDNLDHTIQIAAQLQGDRIRIDIIDDGAPFNLPDEGRSPDLERELDEREIGGLGIHLIKSMVENVGYLREGERNHLVLEIVTDSG